MGLVQVSRGGELLNSPALERHQQDGNTVAYWPLRESLIDDGPNGLDMDLNGTIAYLGAGVLGVLGENTGAFVDDANYGDRPSNDPELTLLGELTIECMVYPVAFTGLGTICTMHASGETTATNFPYLFQFTSSGRVYYFAERGSGTNITTTFSNGVALQLNQWNHIALTRAADGNVSAYVNGGLTGASSGVLPPEGGTSTRFQIAGYPSGNDLEGSLGDLIIYDTQRTHAQIRSDAERMLPTWQAGAVKLSEHQAEANTVGLWQLNGDELDIGPNNLGRLTEVGNFAYDNLSPIERPMRPTTTNYGFQPYDANLALTGAMSAMCLVKLDSIDSLSYLFGFGANDGVTEAGNFLYSVRYAGSGQLDYYAEQGASNGFNFLATGGALTTGVWHHVALTRSAGQVVKLYIDGTNVGTSGTLSTPTGGTSSPFFVGAFITGDIEGVMRSMHVLDREMTPAEVSAEATRLLADR